MGNKDFPGFENHGRVEGGQHIHVNGREVPAGDESEAMLDAFEKAFGYRPGQK